MQGQAKERIEFGAHVLCRNFEVVNASPKIANGLAKTPPSWSLDARRGHFEPGDHLAVDPIDGLGERDVHAIANGPIMEPLRIYLPAGKLSAEEYQERLDLQFRQAGIERSES